MQKFAFFAACAALTTTSTVFGQNSSPVAPASTQSETMPAPACELHIWPAARVAALTQGAGASFGLIGAVIDSASHAAQNKRDKSFITSALGPQAQAKALRELNIPSLLHLPPATVISHDEGIEYKSEDPKRLADRPAACYYDVIIRELFYFKASALKGKMRTFVAVRGYDGNVIKLDYKDSANHALEVKLPKEGEDAGPATDALISAFKADITEFSEKFVRKTNKNKS